MQGIEFLHDLIPIHLELANLNRICPLPVAACKVWNATSRPGGPIHGARAPCPRRRCTDISNYLDRRDSCMFICCIRTLRFIAPVRKLVAAVDQCSVRIIHMKEELQAAD